MLSEDSLVVISQLSLAGTARSDMYKPYPLTTSHSTHSHVDGLFVHKILLAKYFIHVAQATSK